MERPTNKERLTDEELIDRHIDALKEEELINDACARMIADKQHGGQTSAMYTFASTGIITERMTDEFSWDFRRAMKEEDETQLNHLRHLAVYMDKRIEDGTAETPVEGWSKLWLDQETPEGGMTPAQEQALRSICERYKREYDPSHYWVRPADYYDLPRWATGWVGGDESTIYIGVSPEGEVHS